MELLASKAKLAHYTTAEKALLILKGQELWLRSASVMNDVNEVRHGLEIVEKALSDACPLSARLGQLIGPTLLENLRDTLRRFGKQPIEHTFVGSLAEYDDGDKRGTLSMWRAYGGPTAAAALVFNVEF